MKPSIFLKRPSLSGGTSPGLLRMFQSAVSVVYIAGLMAGFGAFQSGFASTGSVEKSTEKSTEAVAVVTPPSGEPSSKNTDEAQGKDSKKKKDKNKKSKKDKKGKKELIEVHIPVNHTAAGIKLPDFDENGKLKMTFEIGSAFRKDEKLLELKDLVIETYGEDSNIDLRINMPSSTFNLETRILTSSPSESPIVIRRDDIEVTGSRLTFDTRARKGRFVGATKVVIFNRDDLSPSENENENEEK